MNTRTLLKILLGGLFAVSGVLHFVKTESYLRIMPTSLPFPRELVLASGAAAVFLGLLLFWRKAHRFAGWGMTLYLVAVFPANLHMAFHPGLFPEVPAWAAWLRLPMQGVLIFAALRATHE